MTLQLKCPLTKIYIFKQVIDCLSSKSVSEGSWIKVAKKEDIF